MYHHEKNNRSSTVIVGLVSLLIFACGNKEEPSPHDGPQSINPPAHFARPTTEALKDSIALLEKKAFATDGKIDRAVAVNLLRVYQDYYNFHPDDADAPACLFKAADVARGLDKYKLSIDLLTNLHDAYTQYPRRDEVAFMIAFTYDAHLHDTLKAIDAYNKMIELYPKSGWVDDAQFSIRNLQMSKEELIKFLEEQNKSS